LAMPTAQTQMGTSLVVVVIMILLWVIIRQRRVAPPKQYLAHGSYT